MKNKTLCFLASEACSLHKTPMTPNHWKCFFTASDWQAVLGQLANGRTAEEFRGAKVQAGAMQHSVFCQQDYKWRNFLTKLSTRGLPPALTKHYRGAWRCSGVHLPLLCLPATPEGFWLMPICLDGTYINHTLIESHVHSPAHMCLLVTALKL